MVGVTGTPVGRRTLLAAALALGLVGPPVLSGCSGPGLDLARASLDRRAAGSLRPADLDGLARFSGTALDLMTTAVDEGNVICSPLSMWVALAMTRNGARGTTAEQMDAALQYPELGALNDRLNTLDQLLDRRSGKKKVGERSGEVRLDLVNQVFGEQTITWREDFLAVLAEFYGTGVARADFVGASGRERDRINGWVADATQDKITDLLPIEAITPDTRMVLVNAIYLKAPWATRFSDPVDGTFTGEQGQAATPMMTSSYRGRAAQGSGWQAVEIPYLGGELAMTVVLPERGSEQQVRTGLGDGLIGEVLTGLTSGATITLTMPTYSFRSRASLKSMLESLGMTDAFGTGADLSGLTDQTQLLITDVFHQGWIAVDAEGTEAAAATAVVAAEASAPVAEHPVELVLDRPFWFVIHDVATGTPLLVGRVADPTAG